MNAGWLALALVIVAVAVGGYALLLGIRYRKLQRRVEELGSPASKERP